MTAAREAATWWTSTAPGKLIEVVAIGNNCTYPWRADNVLDHERRVKYFAIIPAMFCDGPALNAEHMYLRTRGAVLAR